MEKRKKLLSAILSVSMIASAFTALPLSASAEGEQNSGEEVTATVSPSTTAGVTTTGEPVATATTEVESTDEPATAATPEATGVVYEDQKIKITNAKADKVTIVISKYYDNKTLAGVELKENVTLENGSGEVAYDLQGKAAKIMVWDDIKTMTPLFATTSVEGTVDPAPTVKPTAPTSQPETTPTAEPTATPTVKPTEVPREYTEIYTQDYEDVADTSALKNIWASANYADGITLGTDNTKYAQYTDADKNTRSATSAFDVDLSSQNKYAVEFDLALTKSSKDDVQFVVASGTMPTANTGMTSNYIFKINMAGNSNNCKINDVDAATVTLTDAAWYHYTILVDKNEGLATVNITDKSGEKVVDKLIVPTNGVNDKITGILFLSGRYQSVMKLDNIVVRTTDKYDEFGQKAEETLSKVEFASELNTTINQPNEGEPVHKPIAIKATGIYGGDLTNKEGLNVEWTVTGLDKEDGYISLTKAEGTGEGTDGESPNGNTTAYFNVRNGVSNWFGKVTAKVTYLDESFEISTPFAVIGASGSTNIAPDAGYPENMSSYDDSLVGYTATSNTINSKDLVLNGWSIYGSNGVRTLTLKKDEDNTKYLQFASNGGGGSTVGVYQLAEQASQYIVDMKVRFTGGAMAFGHYGNTPNNATNNPNWTVSYGSGALTVGTQSIPGVNSEDWYRVIVSADESVGTYWVKVYNDAGTLVGETTAEAMSSTYTETQKYFCFQGTYPVDLASFKIYTPTASTMTVNTEAETIQVPETGANSATAELTAIVKDTDGYNISGAVTWSLADEYTGVSIASKDAQAATLTVTDEAAAGTVTVVATYGSKRVEKEISLSTTGNAIAFTKSSSSITIPFEGSDAVTGNFAAEVRDKAGQPVEGANVTLSLVDAAGTPVTNAKGITFDATTGVLTVQAGAVSKVLYVKAVATVGDETLTSRVKVNVHGLSFAFGSNDPSDDSFTKVTAADAYSDKIGYGFDDTSVVTSEESDVKGTAAYRFKAKVPNGNYVVKVTTSSATMTSEVVEGVAATTGITKTGTQFNVAVCDGVLDLTFESGSTLSDLTITQAAAKAALAKPAVYAIGDSTTNNNASGNISWGNRVGNGVAVPDTFSSFSNNGMAGRDSVNFYNQGRVETVLLSVCPGDYVTVNMGINSKEAGESASYYTLLNNYYVEGIIQRGAIPVIVTATPLGFSSSQYPYNASTGKFTVNRGTGAYNGDLRKIAQSHNLNIIELGYYFEDYFNSLTAEDVAAYNAENGTSFTSQVELVKSWYGDHNHYKQYLADKIGSYILDSVSKIAGGSTDFNQANDTHINEQ